MNKTDVELINSILSGDNTAFTTLVQKYQKSVHTIAWQRVKDYHIAEEIAQDVFLQVYDKLSTLKDLNKFARWLYVITKRRCTNWLQREKTDMQSLEDIDGFTLVQSAYEHYVAEQCKTAESEHLREVVNSLLDILPERERTVITLYYLGEMTTEEISEFLDVSVNTITSRLRRARLRLMEEKMLTVECYEHVKFKGKKITILKDIANLQEQIASAGFEDKISSVRVIKDLDFLSVDTQVVLHGNPNFSGVILPIRMEPDVSKIDLPNLKELSISSIKFGGDFVEE